MNTNAGIKVSVIIPVYNMAKWVGNAIEKVENQTLKELEIICIDDGSTDDTFQILQQYKRKYTNVQVIHQKNVGSGPARNVGIKRANGEYVAFLDADDYYYTNDALEYLYNKAIDNNAMICRGSSCDNREGVISYKSLRSERVFTKGGFIDKSEFPGATGMWAGIYNRQFLVKNEVWFPDLLRGQDGVFSIKAIARAGKVYCVPKTVYVYRKEHKMVRLTEEKATSLVEASYEILKITSENGMNAAFDAWKKEFFGEKAAALYKYAATGNLKMLQIASKVNALIGGGLFEGNEIIDYVNRTKVNKEVFLTHLRDVNNVYMYGAGTVARRVLAFLRDNGIELSAVIVTDLSQNPNTFEGIPVRTIDAINTDQSYEVIIATFWYLHDEIIHTLKENKITCFFPLDLCEFHLWQDEIIH